MSKKKKKKNLSFKRTEGMVRFEYGPGVANAYAGWSRLQRDTGATPVFSSFYASLTDEQKMDINVVNVQS